MTARADARRAARRGNLDRAGGTNPAGPVGQAPAAFYVTADELRAFAASHLRHAATNLTLAGVHPSACSHLDHMRDAVRLHAAEVAAGRQALHLGVFDHAHPGPTGTPAFRPALHAQAGRAGRLPWRWRPVVVYAATGVALPGRVRWGYERAMRKGNGAALGLTGLLHALGVLPVPTPPRTRPQVFAAAPITTGPEYRR